MRVVLNGKSKAKLFSYLKRLGISDREIANDCNVSVRTISNWRLGKSTLPYDAFRQLEKKAGLETANLQYRIVEDWWNNSRAGKLGSNERFRRHGRLGSKESSRKGGEASYSLRKNDKTDIFARKLVASAPKNIELAEFMGIMIGDGGITAYQVVITTNSEDDREYSQFTAQLIQKLFSIRPSVKDRKDSKCTRIVVSSRALVEQLTELGLKQGHKLNQGLDVPSWIQSDDNYMGACLQGIFDTDGSIYQEKHYRKNKIYCYPRLSFVSMSPQLRKTIYAALKRFGFSPKIRGNRSVNLEQRKDIDRYFTVIGTSNPKHLRRYRKFGEVG